MIMSTQITDVLPSSDGANEQDSNLIQDLATVHAIEQGLEGQKRTKSAAVLAREMMMARRQKEKAEKQGNAERVQTSEKHIEYIQELQQELKEQPEMQNAVQLIKYNLEKHALQPTNMPTTPEVAANAAADVLQHINGQTSRYDVNKLLAQLNVNRDLQLSKRDTADLLASILTCNETQLQALISNPKIPVSIKTIIKRIQLDANLGNIETVEKLWDRLFGKQGLQDQTSISTQTLQASNPDGSCAIIPNTPISREAYVILRETILK